MDWNQCVLTQHAFCSQLSARHWNQDEEFGGFGGAHCVLPAGYGSIMDALAASVADLRLDTPVASVQDSDDGVTITTASGAS